MGTVAYGLLGMGTVVCGFLGMGTAAYALLEMGILVYALLEIEIVVWLVNVCVEQEIFDVVEMVTSRVRELGNDDGGEKVTSVTKRMVIFCEHEIPSEKTGMDVSATKVTLSWNKVISVYKLMEYFLENASGEKLSI
jgi:hypothetical protein